MGLRRRPLWDPGANTLLYSQLAISIHSRGDLPERQTRTDTFVTVSSPSTRPPFSPEPLFFLVLSPADRAPNARTEEANLTEVL